MKTIRRVFIFDERTNSGGFLSTPSCPAHSCSIEAFFWDVSDHGILIL